jgi:hypothetical protein
VGDTAGQGAQGFQFTEAQAFCFGSLPLADIFDNSLDYGFAGGLNRTAGDVHRNRGAIFSQDPDI